MNTEQERAAFEAWAASIGFCVTGKYAETIDVLCAESAFKAGYQAGRAALLAEKNALQMALEDELIWHEAQDKALSKQPNANTGHTWWRRMQHQEHAVVIRAALGQRQEEA